MSPRFRLSLALVAVFGIMTTHSLLVIDLMNLTEEQKKGPVPVKLGDTVSLECGKLQPLRQWVRIRELDVTFYNITSNPHNIRNFTMQDDGNYQCQSVTDVYSRCSNVVLCEAADDFSTCRSEGQTYRHLIKYSPSNSKRQLNSFHGEPIKYERSRYYTYPPKTVKRVSIESGDELYCRHEILQMTSLYWFIIWQSEWLNLEEQAQSRSNPETLIPMHRGNYYCASIIHEELLNWHSFQVIFKDELMPPSYIEVTSMRELDGLMQDNLNISCDIQMTGSSTITWVRSDVCPNTGTTIYQRKILMDPRQTSSPLDVKVLQITELSSKDEGCYTCFAKSGNETFFQTQRLRILQPSSEITRLPAASDDELNTCSVTSPQLEIVILCVVFSLFALIVANIIYLWRSKRRLRRECISSPQPKMVRDLSNRPTSYLELLDKEEVSQRTRDCSKSDIASTKEVDHETYEHGEFTPWELRPENLKLGDILKEDDFHTLYRAQLVDVSPERSIDVAVKISKAGITNNDLLVFVSEMEIMKCVGRHTNVLGLLGTCTRTDALFFVMEFAEHGNLRDRLRQRDSSLQYDYIHQWDLERERLSVHINLVSYARQVAVGMDYLASRRCIHRDLQTKHVLIGNEDILKITDYATKRVRRVNFQAETSDNNLCFARWMAPETLFSGIYTTEANVWSYGILLWEIMTFAETPYPLILTTEELVARLKREYYMDNPEGCPDDIYKLMRRCWNKHPGERPRFHQLAEDLDGVLKDLSDRLQRLDSNKYQKNEHANAACKPSHKQSNDSEYDDVVAAIGGRISRA